jgi:hypothetical protein
MLAQRQRDADQTVQRHLMGAARPAAATAAFPVGAL